MIGAEAVLRRNRLQGMILPRQAVPRPFGVDRSPAARQSGDESTALSGGSVVIAQDAAEALPTMHRTGPAPDLDTCVDQAIAEALTSCCWRLLQPVRMARRSCHGWRTKFMVDPTRQW